MNQDTIESVTHRNLPTQDDAEWRRLSRRPVQAIIQDPNLGPVFQCDDTSKPDAVWEFPLSIYPHGKVPMIPVH